MRALLLAVALIATPATAGVWTNKDCTFTVESIDGAFVIFTKGADDAKDGVTCKITNWPLSSPVAQLDCDDDTKAEMKMATRDGPIVFDGRELAVWREGACKD